MKYATVKYTENVRAYAVFERSTNQFAYFVPGYMSRHETLLGGPDYIWIRLSVGQHRRLPGMTDGDGCINATAKNIGFDRVRIFAR